MILAEDHIADFGAGRARSASTSTPASASCRADSPAGMRPDIRHIGESTDIAR